MDRLRAGDKVSNVRRVVMGALAVIVAGIALPITPAAAAPPTSPLVISELMYHPPETGDAYPSFRYNEDAEFVEVANRSNRTINVSGWCLADGVAFCFPGGTSIAAGDEVVIARDNAAYNALWGGTPDYNYSGKLSNGGELLTLNNSAGTEVDRVDYDDEGLWPVTPDELGTSLERIDLNADGDDAANWSASVAASGHTAGQANSVAGNGVPPLVLNHAAPTNHPANQSIAVTADITGATAATLEYLVDHGNVQTVPMSGNGNTFSATVPGQAAGSLVRYRVLATGNGGTRSGPRPGDTIGWWGLTIADSTASNVPVVKWFVDPADYQNAYTNFLSNTPCNGDACPMVLAYDGQVWDNVRFRVRGFTGRRANKKAWKMQMPKSHDFDPAFLSTPLDEFSLDPGRPQWDGFREALSWKLMEDADVESTQLQHVHVEQNDAFYGYYLLREDTDGSWRERNGYDDDEFYKARPGQVFEKRENKENDNTELSTLRTCLANVRAGGNSDCLYDLVDIPYAINELAAIAASANIDQREFNFLYAQDPSGAGRWRMLPDDLDRSWGTASNNQSPTLTAALRQCQAANNGRRNDVCGAIYAVPELRAAFYRRIRTIYDEFMAGQQIEAYLDSLVATAEPSWTLDAQAWGETTNSLTEHRNFIVNEFLAPWRNYLANGGDGQVPAAQQANLSVSLGTVDYAPATSNLESIEIVNAETTAVDLSGWQLSGAGLTLPPGTVIPAGGTAVAVLDDAAYTQANSGDYVIDVFPNALSNTGGDIALLNTAGATVDTFSWGAPAEPSIILNEWNAVSSSAFLDDGAASDPFWGAVAGNGGDWFELVVIEDNVDLRGLELIISDDTGSLTQDVETLVFSNSALWSDIRSGTIITVSEDLVDDVSYDPAGGDWSINVQANNAASGTYVTANNFKVSKDNWQLTIGDGNGGIIFGPAGEGVAPASGVGSKEVGKLEANPSALITPLSPYNDGTSSSFGAPNRWSAGTEVQDLSVLRSVVDPAPDTMLETPIHRSTETSSPVDFSGTATDPGGGVSVVQVAIRDVSTGLWLRNDGSFGTFQWQATDLANPGAEATGWSTAIELATGSYRVLARATDNTGNRDLTRPTRLFDVATDTEPANGEVSTPQAHEVLGLPTTISGTATDDVAVDRVRIAIRDLNGGTWFDASTGTFGPYRQQDATLTSPGAASTGWNITLNLPEGSYAVSVRAVDHLGKADTTRPWVRFTVQGNVTDTTAPNATVTTPTRLQNLAGPNVTLDGEATDNVAVNTVGIAVRDRTSLLWLQPDGSFGTYTRIPATLTGAGTQVSWSLDVTLPPGNYGMLARVDDTAGNVDPTKPWVVFVVS